MKAKLLQISKMPLAQLDEDLRQAYDVSLLSEQNNPADFLQRHGADFHYLVTSAAIGVTGSTLAALPNLQCISSFGVGYDAIDKDAALQQHLRVGYTPGVLNDCVADLAFGLLIDVARGISASDRFVRAGQWTAQRFPTQTRVSGKKLGIVGLGRIGSTIAKRASGFDMEVAYHNRRPVDGSPFQYHSSLLELAKWADFLVVAAAGGSASRHLINAEVLKALGPKSFLINIARGTVVDEAALLAALQNQTIAGAGLDVFEQEPTPLSGLLQENQAVLTAHIASGTHETRQAMAQLVLDNLHSFIATGQLLAEVPWSAAQ